MLVIKRYAGIVMKNVLSMVCFQAGNDTGAAVVKELLLKIILTKPVNIVPPCG